MNWSSTTKYVDIDTGEQITAAKAKEYLTIKTTKHAKINYREGKGHIEYTKQCRRNPQGKLNFSG